MGAPVLAGPVRPLAQGLSGAEAVIIDAWLCERCGRLYPAEYEDVLPEGWLLVGVERWGKGGPLEPEEPRTFCSDVCAGLWFRNAQPAKATPRKKPAKAVAGPPPALGTNGRLACPECGKNYELPQHLGMHRKREHGVASQRDLLERKG